VLPWPVLVWRMRGMHPAGTLIICLITLVHTTVAGYGIAALCFIAVTGELTNTSRLTALNCGVAGLLISIGAVAWLPNHWRIPLRRLRPISELVPRRHLTWWYNAIFVALVALIATVVVERKQAWVGTTKKPYLPTVEHISFCRQLTKEQCEARKWHECVW